MPASELHKVLLIWKFFAFAKNGHVPCKAFLKWEARDDRSGRLAGGTYTLVIPDMEFCRGDDTHLSTSTVPPSSPSKKAMDWLDDTLKRYGLTRTD